MSYKQAIHLLFGRRKFFLAFCYFLLGLVVAKQYLFKWILSYLGMAEIHAAPQERQSTLTPVCDFCADVSRKIPFYIDMDVGNRAQMFHRNGTESSLTVLSIEAESRDPKCPRTRVKLLVDGETHYVYCGMENPHRGGIKPLTIHNLKIAVEVTRLLFPRISSNKSPFNTFKNFNLEKDVRLAIWEADGPALKDIPGSFVVNQRSWTRDRFANWLQSTGYGLHSAIDIFATQSGIAEQVMNPVDGVVYKVYNKEADPNSQKENKVINLYGRDTVTAGDDRILFRFMHLSQIFVSNGDVVKQGQVIGLTGHTGFDPAIGDHLHFEMRLNAKSFGLKPSSDIFSTIPVNPYNYLLDWWNSGKRG